MLRTRLITRTATMLRNTIQWHKPNVAMADDSTKLIPLSEGAWAQTLPGGRPVFSWHVECEWYDYG